MSGNANERICETCVYCSFGGYCDEHGKHLTSVELPACEKYERHPLLVQVEQLKALCNEMHNCMCDWKEESWGFGRYFAERMYELGVPIGRRWRDDRQPNDRVANGAFQGGTGKTWHRIRDER